MAGGICPCCGQDTPDGRSLVVSLETNIASRWGRTVRLTPQQAEILHILSSRAPGTVREEPLVSGLYGYSDPPEKPSKTLRVQMVHIRNAVAPLGVNIKNVFGIGYRLVLDQWPPIERSAA